MLKELLKLFTQMPYQMEINCYAERRRKFESVDTVFCLTQ